MTLTSLTLENIGLYKGKNILDLRLEEGKNIILFGGKNGTGKTTLLESIKLCLYGNHIYGYTKKQYEKFVKEVIHKGEKSAQISLEFVHFSLESRDTYKIVRKWHIDKHFKEDFFLYKNGKIFAEIPRKQWQEFISGIVPPTLVDFFFFDGEKIEKLAKEFSEVGFVNDIKSLLGVTIIESLKLSLDILRKRYLKQVFSSGEFSKNLQKLERSRDSLEKELERKFQILASIENKRQMLEKEITVVEREFLEKGGEAFKNYEINKAKKELLEREISEIKNEIRELASKDLPLGVGVDLVEELLSQLELEKEIKRKNFEKEILEKKYKELEDILASFSLEGNILEKIRKLFTVNGEIKADIIHDLSERETRIVETIISNLMTNTLSKVKNLFSKLEKLEEDLLEVESVLQSAPEEDIIRPYLDKITQLERKRVEYEAIRKRLEEEIAELEREKRKIEREIKHIEDLIKDNLNNQRVISVIEKSLNVVDKFEKEFVKRKIKTLEKEILNAFYRLKRKENFIKDLYIDPETFEITLLDVNNRRVPIDRLSSGERQIFAIAFLWGLTRTSGKRLPVIIDTPLGRLDNEHRENLVKNYFPNVSHQVIILSTDVEIDNKLFNMLKGYVSHSYQLIYDENCMCTRIYKGYFWD